MAAAIGRLGLRGRTVPLPASPSAPFGVAFADRGRRCPLALRSRHPGVLRRPYQC